MQLLQSKNYGLNPIMADNKANFTSDRYQFIDSKKILSFFESQGYNFDGASYGRVKLQEKNGYQKHIMAFSRPDLNIDGENKMQVLALNSHDGSGALKLYTGVYRAICANGLISGDTLHQQKITHIGNIENKLKDSLNYIASHIVDLKNQVRKMQDQKINQEQALAFLNYASDCRFENIDNIIDVDLQSLNKVRRAADSKNDIFTYFNRVQEAVIRGGVNYRKIAPIKDKNGHIHYDIKHNTTRQLSSVKKQIDLNQRLWNKAVELCHC